MAFLLLRCLPANERGPVLCSALARLASELFFGGHGIAPDLT